MIWSLNWSTQPESSATAAEPGGASSALGGAVEGAALPEDDSPALGGGATELDPQQNDTSALGSPSATQPESSATAANPGGASSALGGAVEKAAQPEDDSPAQALESKLVTQPESSATAAEPGGASSALGGAVEGAALPEDDSPALGGGATELDPQQNDTSALGSPSATQPESSATAANPGGASSAQAFRSPSSTQSESSATSADPEKPLDGDYLSHQSSCKELLPFPSLGSGGALDLLNDVNHAESESDDEDEVSDLENEPMGDNHDSHSEHAPFCPGNDSETKQTKHADGASESESDVEDEVSDLANEPTGDNHDSHSEHSPCCPGNDSETELVGGASDLPMIVQEDQAPASTSNGSVLEEEEEVPFFPFLHLSFPIPFRRRLGDVPKEVLPHAEKSSERGENPVVVRTANCEWKWDTAKSCYTVKLFKLPLSEEETFLAHVMLECHEFTVIFQGAFKCISSKLFVESLLSKDIPVQAIKFTTCPNDAGFCTKEEAIHYFVPVSSYNDYVEKREADPTQDIELQGWVNDVCTQANPFPLKKDELRTLKVASTDSIYAYDVPSFVYTPMLKDLWSKDSPFAPHVLQRCCCLELSVRPLFHRKC